MGSITALDWLFSSPAVFLLVAVLIMMMITLLSNKNYKSSVLIGVLTLTYGGFSGNQYVSGLMYVTIVAISLLVANKVYNSAIGDSEGI